MRNLRTEQEIIESWRGDTSKPVVSICCITYNHELYIEDALEGFLIQETEFPFEIVIHDDASTDHTADIIRKYEAKYPNLIKPIYQTENQYSKGSRIFPIISPHCKGEYIAICEGDDYWLSKNKITKQYLYLKKNPNVSLCFHKTNTVDAHKINLNVPTTHFSHGDSFTTIDIIKQWFIHTNTIMLPKKYVEIIDNSLFDGIKNLDWLIHLICSLQGEIHYISGIESSYRKHTTSLSYVIGKDKINRAINLILLFDRFDVYSKFKFNKEIASKKVFFLEELIDYKMKEQMMFFYYFVHPVKFLLKLNNKFGKSREL